MKRSDREDGHIQLYRLADCCEESNGSYHNPGLTTNTPIQPFVRMLEVAFRSEVPSPGMNGRRLRRNSCGLCIHTATVGISGTRTLGLNGGKLSKQAIVCTNYFSLMVPLVPHTTLSCWSPPGTLSANSYSSVFSIPDVLDSCIVRAEEKNVLVCPHE